MELCYDHQRMIHLTLITVGDFPKGPFQTLGEEYKKRLTPFVKLDHRVVSDETKIEKQIPENCFVIVLDERGNTATSHQVAKVVGNLEDRGEHICVIIGGPKGLSDETKRKAKLRLALSSLTLTHDFAHLLFLEQLYRAFTILRGKEYHY